MAGFGTALHSKDIYEEEEDNSQIRVSNNFMKGGSVDPNRFNLVDDASKRRNKSQNYHKALEKRS